MGISKIGHTMDPLVVKNKKESTFRICLDLLSFYKN
jgi:hypothetical protein